MLNSTKHFATVIMTALILSCNNETPQMDEMETSSTQTSERINDTFHGKRIDSIQSYEDYANIKMTYDGIYLKSYKECYADGKIHDGVSFTLKWTKDTIFINGGIYKAVIGDNGCVSKLICPSGKINHYTYDSENHLIAYDMELVDLTDIQNMELEWHNGNMIRAKENYTSNEYIEYFYTYGNEPNTSSLLPPCRSYNWIDDAGKAYGYGVNATLYYAGVLGKGTVNLPTSSRNKWSSGQINQSYSFTYNFTSDNYIKSAQTYEGIDYYFYK